jgi:alpha-1,2-mannosyltransferase
VTFLSFPSLLALAEPSLWQISRPWYLAWAGLVYVVVAVATFAWIAVTGQKLAARDTLRPAEAHPS